jgi:phosphatidylglycerol---prolipoprotein diacylglyceryl transferase
MIEKVFSIGSFAISPFGVMLVIAFIAAYLQLRWGLRYQEIGDEEDASALLFAAGIAGIVGGKIYYACLYGSWRLLFDRSGLVWYGGFLLAVPAVLWTMRRRRLPAWGTADATALSLALGYGIGRIGCFLVGDDWGLPTTLPWGVRFPVGPTPSTAGELRRLGVDVPASISSGTLVAVHPTQVYETVLAVVIWLIGLGWFRRRPAAGSTALLVVGLLAVERFAVEFLRAKDDRFFGHFTLAQLLSLAVLVAAAAIALYRRRRPAAQERG